MGARIGNVWENVRSSLWLVPALLSAAAAGLAALFLWIDEVAPALGGARAWLFGGTADAAQTLLSAIAGSLITVVALAFSITIVAVQQASSQYSPRVIRNFIEDRGNKIVFGVYIATFIYALLVLRQIRAPSESIDAFVPALSITGALALAIVCMALLIYYIHHIATSLQVTTIAEEIAQGLRETIEHLYPTRVAEPLADEDDRSPALPDAPPSFAVTAREAGYLRAIDVDQLLGALDERVAFVRVRPQVGSSSSAASRWRRSGAAGRPTRRGCGRPSAGRSRSTARGPSGRTCSSASVSWSTSRSRRSRRGSTTRRPPSSASPRSATSSRGWRSATSPALAPRAGDGDDPAAQPARLRGRR